MTPTGTPGRAARPQRRPPRLPSAADVPRRTTTPQQRRQQTTTIVHMYVEEKKPIQQIADELGFSYGKVQRTLTTEIVQMRPRGGARRGPARNAKNPPRAADHNAGPATETTW